MFTSYGNFGITDAFVIDQVWQKATIIPGNDPNVWRKDCCGAWIKRSDYGDRSNRFGWEIDHIVPESAGGSDALFNLQPLHWKNNSAKGDGPLVCAVSSYGTVNIGV